MPENTTESDLSKRDVAELVHYGPEYLVGDLSEEAYTRTVNQWAESRPDDVEQLEDADCFEWHNAYWEIGGPQGRGLEFEVITGVEWRTDDDPRKEIADVAWEFVSDWIDALVGDIQKRQAQSLFSRQELRVYWMLDSRTKKDLKTMLDVSYPTIRDYEERADNDIERANATLGLTYEDA
jgi:hypothetical protein